MAILVWACSTKQNTVLSRGYHATTTKYNILYNGQLAYDKGIETLKTKYHDDFNEILTVERMQPDNMQQVIQKDKDPNFQRAEEKAIKAAQLHSIYIAGTENNPQMDEAYLLLGKARYHDLRYVPALEAFNYITMKYPDSNIFYDAVVWTEKTNLRLNYDNLAIKNLKKVLKDEQLKEQTKADALATLAQGYINISSLDSAMVPLKEAIALTGNLDEKARYTYILGQLNSRTQNKKEAIANFEEIIQYNHRVPRAYLIHAYAEKFANQDPTKIDSTAFIKEYQTLLKDRENRPFQDVIFHQMGVLYDAYENNAKAITYYNRSLKRVKDNDYLKVSNYSKLADIYYQKKAYETAGKYYDSTMVFMNPSTRAYLEVKRKRNGLLDIVKFESIARENDSILRLVQMSPAERKTTIEKWLTEKRMKDEAAEKAQARAASSGSSSGGALPMGASSSFYFYSANALTKGKQDFARKWGNRPLVDNWRWQEEATLAGVHETTLVQDDSVADTTAEETTAAAGDMRYNADFFIAQIPSNEEEIQLLKKDRDNAYYQLGVLYSDRLEAYEIAADRLEKLLTFAPETRLIEPTKYHLYKIYLKINPSKAQALLQDMQQNYPNSEYTKIMLNPEAKISLEDSPISEYERVYKMYTHGAYAEVLKELNQTIPNLMASDMLSKYELLKATTVGKLNGLEEYQTSLNYVALTYPNSIEGKEAQRILTEDLPKLQAMSFKMDMSRNLKMIYEVTYPLSKEDEELRNKLQRYANDRSHVGIKFSADMYSANKMFLVLHGIKSGNLAKSAQMYLEIEKDYGITQTPVLISSDDYSVVLIKKNWDAYMQTRFSKSSPTSNTNEEASKKANGK